MTNSSVPPPSGPITFRVRTTRAQSGVLGGLILACGAGVLTRQPPAEVGIWSAVAMAAGFVIGRRRSSDHCSNPECRALLAPDVKTCPKCERKIAGTIDDPNQRLEAEETARRKRRRSKTG